MKTTPLFAGTEDLTHKDEVEALLGVARDSLWRDKVTVMVHHIPESEESVGEYEAVDLVLKHQ